MRRIVLFYISISVTAILATWAILRHGKLLEIGRPIVAPPFIEAKDILSKGIDGFLSNLHHPLAILILQILSIIVAARLFGLLFTRIGQPTVIG